MNMEMATTTMSRNGQVVIPLSLRKAMGLGNKDRFLVVGDGDTIALKRLTTACARNLRPCSPISRMPQPRQD
jgi:AbrB family looped-hinge helix DNA binding protein